MEKVFKFIHCGILALALNISATAMADTTVASEAENIQKAVELYAEAVPMDHDSGKKRQLLEQAAALLNKVIDNNPQSLDAHRKLMGVYLQLRDYGKGIRTMQDAITLSPEDPKLFITLAFLYEHSGAFDYAIAMLDQALALDPEQKLAKDYKLSIQQKIDARNQNMEELHKGENMMQAHPGKTSSAPPHPVLEPTK